MSITGENKNCHQPSQFEISCQAFFSDICRVYLLKLKPKAPIALMHKNFTVLKTGAIIKRNLKKAGENTKSVV